jgi:hypothetical protein
LVGTKVITDWFKPASKKNEEQEEFQEEEFLNEKELEELEKE